MPVSFSPPSISVSSPYVVANVYTSATNLVWKTDKAKISTGSSSVTYQVYLYPNFTDTMYSTAIQVPANSSQDVQICVGNKVTVVGSNFTISEIGTASSGTAGVNAI